MSAKTKIVVLRMREVIYTAVFALLGVCLIILLILMFLKGKKSSTELPGEKQTPETGSSYIAGVYTTSVTLYNQVISVEVVLDEDHINSVRLVHTDDTVTTMFPLFENTMPALAKQIVDSQSLDGITYTEDSKYASMILLAAVKNALTKAELLP